MIKGGRARKGTSFLVLTEDSVETRERGQPYFETPSFVTLLLVFLALYYKLDIFFQKTKMYILNFFNVFIHQKII